MIIGDDKAGSSQSRQSSSDRPETNPFRSPPYSYSPSQARGHSPSLSSSSYAPSRTSSHIPSHASSHAPSHASSYVSDHTSKYTPTPSHAPDYFAPPRRSPSLDHHHTAPTDDSAPPMYSPRVPARYYTFRDDDFQTADRSQLLESGPSSFEYDRKSGTYGADLAGTAAFQSDGRLRFSFDSKFPKKFPDSYGVPVEEIGIDLREFESAPPMNINIMIVGSRGDVQPYLALGQKLRQHGHKVRLATHETFRKLVKDAGLRFFNIGGDPHELMSYMVRNPGLIPGFQSVIKGDIGKKQKMVAEILDGCWRSCYEADDKEEGGTTFAADAIISNPPAFAHIHCAEALGIPLLMSFTMPWCSTAAFPHPLVNIKQSDAEPNMTNYYSYSLVDIMTWQGLGHTINKFRMKRLGLGYLSTASAVSMLERCKVPWTYCLSPALVAKPTDWMAHIDVVGFYFLDLATSFVPPPDLEAFLYAGKPPIYIGFGSIVVDDPKQMTQSVLEAISDTGVRALISPGWGGLDEAMIKSAGPSVFALGNVPHDWLFEHVSAVCHHGGAGTTAIGLRCGKPTIIVPFFGDQPWWAAQIARRGAGPAPLPPKLLNRETLGAAIRMALSPATRDAAQRIGEMIKAEGGAKNGVDSFHRHLPLLNMRCDIDPNRVAVWYSPQYKLRLSAFAAEVLVSSGQLDINELKLHRPREYDTELKASDPITGAVIPQFQILTDVGRGVAKLASTRPDKGVVKILGAIPKSMHGTLRGTQQGFQNLPKYYGTESRESGKITGVGSGLIEGGKGLALGIYDGLADFVMEPVKGYKENGMAGACAGAGRGTLSFFVKPSAGALGFVTHPIDGTIKSIRSSRFQDVSKDRHLTRYREGIVEAQGCTMEQRQSIISTFTAFRYGAKGKGKQKSR